LWVGRILAVALVGTGFGIPSFHTVNDVSTDGSTCPLQTLFNQECPQLCVKDRKLCPSATLKVCFGGMELCQDGECHPTCANLSNPCACGLESFGYLPCGKLARSTVANLVPEFRLQNITAACSRTLRLKPESYEFWSETPTRDALWLSCPDPPPPSFTLTEPMFLSAYAVMAFHAVLFGLWHLLKLFNERGVPRPAAPTARRKPGFEGYCDHPFGTLLYLDIFLVTVAMFALLGVMVADNYGAVGGEAYFIFLSSELVSKTFVVAWYLTSIWLGLLFIAKARLRNYFRLRCDLQTASVVQVASCPDNVTLASGAPSGLASFKRSVRRISALLGTDLNFQTVPIRTLSTKRRYFEFRCVRFVSTEAGFSPCQSPLPASPPELLGLSGGLSGAESMRRLELFGPNRIAVRVTSVFAALSDELMTFSSLYQMMFLWIWYFFTYYQMGLVQTAVIFISAVIQVVIRIRSETQIRGLAEISADFEVLRDGRWVTVASVELVPGDVFRVEVGRPVPCDAVLLSGEVIVNESMLTGEAMPVRKLALNADLHNYKPSAGPGHSLISGTTVLQSIEGVALCTATGINTDKGTLIRRILFPSTYSFVFTDQLQVVILILLGWGAVCFLLSMYFMGRGDVNSWFYGMFVISQILSPLLPSALVISQSVAARRLQGGSGIACLDLPRIMVAGKVKTFCFDKTGTLTQEGLDFHGFQPTLATPTPVFDQVLRDTAQLPHLAQIAMAACHAVSRLGGAAIGNPVDREQFRASGWLFHDHFDASSFEGAFLAPGGRAHVLVVKRNAFVHARASMSVLVEDPGTGRWHVFIKGSFERIKAIAREATLPPNYDPVTAQLAREGCYVLGMAHRDLGALAPDARARVRGWGRDELERDAEFLGLVLFRNQLKPDTVEAISQLHTGGTRTLMITGDNAFTGIHVARACAILSPGAQVLLGDVGQRHSKGGDALQWLDVDTDAAITTPELQAQLLAAPHPVELAVTERAFDHLVRHDQMRDILPCVRVYARMTPEGKVRCIELLMAGGVVGMCGDGGNDCGALRAAHVGVALSDAEASLVSPFSTRHPSVMGCVAVLRYGRAALASSVACYKFLILYGEIMAWLELTQFYFSVVVSQPVWVVVDGLVTTTMILSLALARPAATLAGARPTARLLGPQTLASAISQSLVNLGFLILAIGLLFRQPFFKCHEFDGGAVDSAKWWLMGDNYEAEVIALVCLAQFINAAGAFNFGYVFRAGWWRNRPLLLAYFGLLGLVTFLTLAGPNRVSCLFRINCGSDAALAQILKLPPLPFAVPDYNSAIGHNVMPFGFRARLLALIAANCALNLAVEYFLILHGPLPALLRRLKNPSPSERPTDPLHALKSEQHL
ncbi:hypothetical protein L0F63_003763, partial [Massospora cicadina]